MNARGRDLLGEETDEMLRERCERSKLMPDYKGQRLPYEPRQGPVQKTDAQIREGAFEHEIEALEEKYNCWLEGDYYVRAREHTHD